ncbi:hypothetical protein BJX65DRAFT_317959 [Aspergillus insuetus]
MELQCEICHQQFTRREHLERHLRRHSGIRPFPCPLCSRTFSRRDTLARHLTTHGTGAEGLLARARGANACVPCSRAKLKCNGDNPCGRCASKNRNCVYRDSEKSLNPVMASSAGATHMPSRSITGSDTMELGEFAPDLQYNAIRIPSGQADMRDILACGTIAPTVPDIDYSLPWMLDYTSIFPDGLAGDQQPVLDLATQFPYSPLASNSPSAMDQISNYDIREFQNIQEHYSSQLLNTSRLSIMDATEEDIIIAENFCHIRVPLERHYKIILEFAKNHFDGRFKEVPFPSQSAFNSFIQLYYEYFDCRLSFIHRSTLEHQDTPWLLVLAVASIGSQYTQLPRREQYSAMLTELLRLSLPLDVHKARGYDVRMLAQCSLLAIVSLMFTGFKDNVINLQVQRAWLATLVRPFVTSPKLKSSLLCQEVNYNTHSDEWSMWIRSEMERRLAYCFLVVDSLSFIFLGTPTNFTAKDYQQILPSSETLWATRNADEWRALSTLDGRQTHSLKELLLGPAVTASASQTSDLAKLCQHLMLFVEEQQTRTASQSWILRDLSGGDQNHNPGPPQLSFNCLDWRYQMLIPSSSAASSAIRDVPDMRDTFFHLLSILRHIPLDTLYTYSGWYASKDDISSAQAYLRTWFQDNPTLSRECVTHAGALVGKIRSSPTLSCYDPFCLLISVMFLWTFERLRPDSPAATEPTLQASEPPIIFKLDQCHDETIRGRWLWSDPGVLVHITGVGLLSSPGATRRLLQEFIRIIKSHTGWPTLCRGLVVCVSELINGVAPITTSPQSNHGP